jgi:ferredoxin
MKRQIIKIDEEKCTGCGDCIPNCPEGALQIIDGKARLVSDLFCDGLGACIGNCPFEAISVENREAEPYNEAKVMVNIVKAGKNTIIAHLNHLSDHNERELYSQAISYLNANNVTIPSHNELKSENNCAHSHDEKKEESGCDCSQDQKEESGCDCSQDQIPLSGGCPGSLSRLLIPKSDSKTPENYSKESIPVNSELKNWPVQLKLAPLQAQYFNNADMVIAADCVPFSYAGFHQDFIKGHVLLMGCPKLDDKMFYIEKLAKIFELNSIKSLHIVMEEVPCCFGLTQIVEKAMQISGKQLPVKITVVGIQGGIKSTK